MVERVLEERIVAENPAASLFHIGAASDTRRKLWKPVQHMET